VKCKVRVDVDDYRKTVTMCEHSNKRSTAYLKEMKTTMWDYRIGVWNHRMSMHDHRITMWDYRIAVCDHRMTVQDYRMMICNYKGARVSEIRGRPLI
jgi:hypothetical protein